MQSLSDPGKESEKFEAGPSAGGDTGTANDQAAREVVAMQFAGGMSIERLAEDWERDASWVEEAIRQALLAHIPKRDGGLKPPRSGLSVERREELERVRDAQETLWPGS